QNTFHVSQKNLWTIWKKTLISPVKRHSKASYRAVQDPDIQEHLSIEQAAIHGEQRPKKKRPSEQEPYAVAVIVVSVEEACSHVGHSLDSIRFCFAPPIENLSMYLASENMDGNIVTNSRIQRPD
ncbi:hypothetical protein H0H93_014587, partial [Arthromyces matolae]